MNQCTKNPKNPYYKGHYLIDDGEGDDKPEGVELDLTWPGGTVAAVHRDADC